MHDNNGTHTLTGGHHTRERFPMKNTIDDMRLNLRPDMTGMRRNIPTNKSPGYLFMIFNIH